MDKLRIPVETRTFSQAYLLQFPPRRWISHRHFLQILSFMRWNCKARACRRLFPPRWAVPATWTGKNPSITLDAYSRAEISSGNNLKRLDTPPLWRLWCDGSRSNDRLAGCVVTCRVAMCCEQPLDVAPPVHGAWPESQICWSSKLSPEEA